MLQEQFVSMLEVDSREDFTAHVISFVQGLGLPLVAAMTVVDGTGLAPQFRSLHNLPAGYRRLYDDRARSVKHPVMQHCKLRNVPLVWNRATFAANDALALWEPQAAHGLSCGIALALHLPDGHHFCISGSRDQALPANAAELSRMVADLHLFAVYAADAAIRLLAELPAAHQQPAPALTRRELECLQWTLEGKTAWELGRILAISEHTAVRHLNNAIHKLGAVNKHQAALRALRLKLIA
jgi:DNA-binding CsgD family transcriptional regulator